MRAVLSNLMAAMLLSQTVLGWCCQAVDSTRQHQANASSSHASKCSHCQHKSSRDPTERPAAPCTGHKCHGICNYLAPQKLHIVLPDAHHALDLAVDIPSLTATQGTLTFWGELATGPPYVEPPVRLHLWHQVLLV